MMIQDLLRFRHYFICMCISSSPFSFVLFHLWASPLILGLPSSFSKESSCHPGVIQSAPPCP